MDELKINERLIMTPGPVMIDPRVSQAMSNRILGQFDPAFTAIMDDTMALIREGFQTKNRWAFPVDGSGRAGVEALISSIVSPGDKVLVPILGRFGDLAAELAERAGGDVETIETEWGTVFDQDDIISAIKRIKPKVVAMVHGETSTGRLQPLDKIGAALHEYGGFLIVDAVATFMGTSVAVDDWQIDAAVGGAQKCLSAMPGITPVTFNDRFAAEINKRKRIERGNRHPDDEVADNFISSNYLDLTQLQDYWSPARLNHHTESTIGVYGLHEALRLAVHEEGLQARFDRHVKIHKALNAALPALGLEIFNEGDHEMPMVTCIGIPSELDGNQFKDALLDKFGVEISNSFGSLQGKIWRLGTMGYVAQPSFLTKFISLFGAALLQAGVQVDLKAALDALDAVFEEA